MRCARSPAAPPGRPPRTGRDRAAPAGPPRRPARPARRRATRRPGDRPAPPGTSGRPGPVCGRCPQRGQVLPAAVAAPSVSCSPFEPLASSDCSVRPQPARMKVAPIRLVGQLRMGAVIGKQNGHVELRSVVGVLAAGALAGILAAAVALGVAELAAAIIGPNSAPVIAVGETAINLTPIPVKDFAITHFGSHDKLALIAGILVMLAGFAALIGVAAVRRIGYGLGGLTVFAGLGVAAALRLPGAGLLDAVPTLVGVTVAAAVLVTLVRFVRPADGGPALAADGLIGGPGSGQTLATESVGGGARD